MRRMQVQVVVQVGRRLLPRLTREAPESMANRKRKHPIRIRVPWLPGAETMGAGDLISALTTRLGIGPCGGCKRRASRLNRLLELQFGRGRNGRKRPMK